MAEIYNTDRFAVLYTESQAPPLDNLGLAARYLTELFQQNNVPAAFLGGWAIYLRGSGRSTNDVDMTVQSTMPALIQLLILQPRLSIPLQHGATSVQIFVRTGGDWDAGYNAVPVSVDIIINGNLGAPKDMPRGTESINPVATSQGTEPVQVIDLRHQFAAKLSAYYGRQSDNDYIDLTFLFASNAPGIYNFSYQLDLAHRQYFAESYAAYNPSQPNFINQLRQILRL